MTAENGKEVIAKIPLAQIVPPKYVTESEAATLDFGNVIYLTSKNL